MNKKIGIGTLLVCATTLIGASASICSNKEVAKANYLEQSVSWDLTAASYDSAAADTISWTSEYASVYGYKNGSYTNVNFYIPTAQSATQLVKYHSLSISTESGYELSKVVFTLLNSSSTEKLVASDWTNTSRVTSDETTVSALIDDTNGSISVALVGTCTFTGITVYFNNKVNNSFSKIMSTDDLYDGMAVIIGTSDYGFVMADLHDSDNRPGCASYRDGSLNALKVSNLDYTELALGVEEMSDGTIIYTFKDAWTDEYFYADDSGDDEHLKMSDSINNRCRFTVSIVDGVATLTSIGAETYKYLAFDDGFEVFVCHNASDSTISLYAESQTITDKQYVDTFVTKYMKMESISTSNEDSTPSCLSNWTSAKRAYEKLNEYQQFLFVDDSDYFEAALRFMAWAEANGYTLDEYGTLSEKSKITLNSFETNSNNSTTLIIVLVSVLSLASVGGCFFDESP